MRMVNFWMLAMVSSVFLGCAVYSGLYWTQVGGLKGFALMMVALCAAIITGTFSLFYAGDLIYIDQTILVEINQVIVPAQWLTLVQRFFWIPLMVFLFVLIDIWAAENNSHRSITTKTYFWYVRLRGGLWVNEIAHRVGVAYSWNFWCGAGSS